METSDIGFRLASIRGNVTQIDFSKRVGVAKSTWARYERGERDPDAGTLRTLQGWGWSVDWILSGEGPERLDGGPDGTPADERPPIDLDMLETAIAAVEESLAMKRRVMKPKKKAELIAAIYDLYIDEEDEDEEDDSGY